MAVKFCNNFASTLSSGINSSATTISVASAAGLPSLSGNDYLYLTIDTDTGSPTREIVKVTAISSNDLTVVRGQDGTSATSFDAGTKIELRVTAAALHESVSKAVDDLVDSAPGALDTLNELAAALGDDANFSTTVTNSIATKVPLAGGTMTGNLTVPNLSVTSTNWLGWGDYGERIIGSNAHGTLTFQTDATTALQLDSSQNASFSGNVDATGIIKVGTYDAAQLKVNGYSSTYRSIQIGAPDNNGGSVALAIDVSAFPNTASNFPGKDVAFIGKNGLIFPNADADNWIGGIARGSSSDVIHVGPATSGGVSSGPLTLTSTDATFAGDVTAQGLQVSDNITFSGISANAYKGIVPETDQNLMLGTGSGGEPRIYLKGTANGQSDAGDLFLGAGTGGTITLNGPSINCNAALNVGGSGFGTLTWGTIGSGSAFGIRSGSDKDLSIGAGGSWDVLRLSAAGDATFAGNLDVDGSAGIYQRNSSGGSIVLDDTDTADASTPMVYFRNTAGQLTLGRANRNATTGLTTGSTDSLTISSAGAATFAGDVDVTGELDVTGSWSLDGISGNGFKSYTYGTVLDIANLNSGGWARAHKILTSDDTGSVAFGVHGGGTTLTKAYWSITGDGDSDIGYNADHGIFMLKNGDVGFGVQSPTEAIDVSGNGKFSGTVTSETTTGDATFVAYRNQTTLPNSGDGSNLIGAYLFKSSDSSGSEPHYAGIGGFADQYGRMELQFFTERDHWDSDPRVPTLTLDRNKDATLAGSLTLGDGHTIGDDGDDNLVLTSSANENIMIDSAHGVYLDHGTSSTDSVYLRRAGSSYAYFRNSSDDLVIGPLGEDHDIFFQGNDGGSTINMLRLDASAYGDATFSGHAILGGKITVGTTIDGVGAPAAGTGVFGATAAYGAILTGQGTTNDVTVSNDLGESALGVPTGTRNVVFSGNVGVASGGSPTLSSTDLVFQVGSSSYDTPTIQIRSGTSGKGQLWFGDNSGTDVGRYDGYIEYDQSGRDFRIGTACTERMRLNATGLGIGTTSPSSQLHIESASSPTVRLVDTTNDATLLAYAQNSEAIVGTYSAHNLGLFTDSGRTMTLNTSHNVGIGTSSIDAKLHVEEGGEPGANGTLILEANSSSRQIRIAPPSNSANGYIDYRGGNLLFKDDGSETMRFASGGNIVVGHSTVESSIWNITPRLQIEGNNASTSAISIVRNTESASPPYLVLTKTRGGVQGSEVSVQDDDTLGHIVFSGADGTDRASQGGSIACKVDGTPGTGDMPGRLEFYTTQDGAELSTLALTLDSSQNATFAGRVISTALSNSSLYALSLSRSGSGSNPDIWSDNDRLVLGTSASTAALTLLNSDATFAGDITFDGGKKIGLERVDGAGATVGPGWMTVANNTSGRRHGEIIVTDADSGDHGFIRIDWMRSYGDSNFTVFNTGGHSNRITGCRVLSEDGNNTYGTKILQVYVSVSSTYEVDVYHHHGTDDYSAHTAVTPVIEDTKTGYSLHGEQLESLDTYGFAAEEGIRAGGSLAVGGSATVVGTVTCTSLTETSDAALKTDVQPIENALATVSALKGVTYKDKKTGDKRIGFIAQDVQADAPDLAERVVLEADPETKMLGISYSHMTSVLAEAIKEQQTQIESLMKRIKELEDA